LKPRYVALDLETTGLNPDEDEIIEVGAVAFDFDGVVGEYHTFVRPYQSLPFHIERLTGIAASELESAPHFGSIALELMDFIGDSAVVGQSIDFDLAFLARAGLVPRGPVFDTFEMAQVLMPSAGEFSLRNLCGLLGIDFPVRHRALADAEAARCVFLALRRRLTSLPEWLLQELEKLALASDWSFHYLVREVLEAGEPLNRERAAVTSEELIARPEEIARALSSNGSRSPVTIPAVMGLLGRADELAELLPAFERRSEQEEMATAVTRALNDATHLVVEAGTGTGKSLAYLLPAALHAIHNQERVVVSTDTIGLQEQLLSKDLPVVQALVDRAGLGPLRAAQLKGRRNYLCLQRWTAGRYLPASSKDEARLQARLLVWLRETQTGDRAELNLHSTQDAVWGKLSAENTNCLQAPCPFVKQGTCFLLRARRRAEAAHILVVNHALLLSDIATGGYVLPPYERLVIDEAHNLEDEATERFAFKASQEEVKTFLDRVGRRGSDRLGIVGSLNDAMRGTNQILGTGAYLAGLASALAAAATRVRQQLAEPYRLLNAVLRDALYGERDFDDRLLLTRAVRVQPVWSDVQIASENLDSAFAQLTSLLDDLRAVLESGDQGIAGQEVLLSEATELLALSAGYRDGLARALLEEEMGLICWLERSRFTGEVSVCSAPLEVADLLRRALFDTKETVVLTSATLSAEGSFSFFRERVGLEDGEELLLGWPFDFARSTLITVPRDLPEPNEPEFVTETGRLLVEACRASQGRALVLFTSYGSLNAAYEEIKGPLEKEGILVLAHGRDGSPRQLLSALRENPRTVLLGTASFWEGVDVAGEALSLLVIARLPFAVPTDPIYQARSSLYDEPFDEYALPQAVLRFRQGFGRLIRTKTDRGVLVVLDRRIRSRKYGEAFLRSLPRCTLKDLPAREVAGAVEHWLG
jgi:predicted DnaQ family exonuclease/DinG family helicase